MQIILNVMIVTFHVKNVMDLLLKIVFSANLGNIYFKTVVSLIVL
jgi:hypothetical protein